jgi:hypothetical protein
MRAAGGQCCYNGGVAWKRVTADGEESVSLQSFLDFQKKGGGKVGGATGVPPSPCPPCWHKTVRKHTHLTKKSGGVYDFYALSWNRVDRVDRVGAIRWD